MSECQACGAKAQLFLCNRHIAELQQVLRDAPWWIDRLTEAAIGQARLSDGGGRSTARREPFKGDDEVLPKCTCGHPEHEGRDVCGGLIRGDVSIVELVEPDADGNTSREVRAPDRICGCRDYQPIADQAKIRKQFLAAGGVDAWAANLLDEIGNTLTTWIRHLCETRGLPLRNVRGYPPRFIGPLQVGAIRCKRTERPQFWAVWLTEHISALAADEGAGECLRDVQNATERIERAVNRPMPMRFLGRCPTWIEDKRAICGIVLRCREDALEVYCRACRQTHNPDRLQLLMMNDLEHQKLPFDKILEANAMQPAEYQIPPRTLKWWLQKGKLMVRGYRRPDGRIVINRHNDADVALYLWSDIRRLRTEQGKLKTG